MSALLFVSLCLVIPFEILFFWPGFVNAYAVPKLIAALLGAAFVLPQLGIDWFRRPPTPSSRRLFALFGLAMVAVTWATIRSMNPAVSFWGADWRRMGWLTQFAMMLTAACVPVAVRHDFGRWKWLLRAIAMAGALSALYGVFQWLGWEPFLLGSARAEVIAQFGGRYRAPGTIGQATYFATCLVYPLFAAAALMLCETARGWRIVAGAGIVVCATAVAFAAAARSGILGIVAGAAAFVVWLSVPYFTKRRYLTVSVLIVLVALAGVVVGSVRFANFGTDTASIGRLLLWQDVMGELFPHFWISGTGPGMFRAAYAQHRSPSYGLFGPDIHWESAHNIFLDRLSEQGVPGLLALGLLAIAFFMNLKRAARFSGEWKNNGVRAALAGGFIGGLVSSFFNGEVISTTFLLYVWIALSFAMGDADENLNDLRRQKRRSPNFVQPVLVAALASISIMLIWYARANWIAESYLVEGVMATRSHNTQQVLASARKMEEVLPQTGTYSLEVGGVTAAFLLENYSALNDSWRVALAKTGIDASLRAMERTDRPMIALLNMVALGDVISDARTGKWLEQLKQIDPQWARPHEMSARVLLRQGRSKEALREATIAHQLAPYVASSMQLWQQLIEARQQ